ncbi:GNAT family N-acetyltransferase [Bacteriovorax sp. Seq25_V]|uniref:GNAT family N-acetyltransferase n=1 Tax=Bacteriovorax sp. Seq25_V TaxID=1201288 RepID=UPI00038A3D94|nr:GNAT family N-acetyltransferase [Bacteriovorax sp. Seq25_V]EQC44727.1 FR47-like protein [Bacteriovorax sp. Seq25_V]
MRSDQIPPSIDTSKIRQATFEDIISLARVHVDSWWETYKNIVSESYLYSLKYSDRAQMWARFIPRKEKKSGTFVITGSDGDVIGFCDYGIAREHEHGIEGEVYALYLLKKYHGQGIGKALLDAVKSEFKKHGIKAFYVCVLAANPFRDFYLRQGGEFIKSQMIEVGDRTLQEDLICFEL